MVKSLSVFLVVFFCSVSYGAIDRASITYDVIFGSGQYQGSNSLVWDGSNSYVSNRYNDGFSHLSLTPGNFGADNYQLSMSTSDGDGMASWRGLLNNDTGAIVMQSSVPFTISDMSDPHYGGMSVVVPEPSSWSFGFFLVVSLLLLRRRRHGLPV